MDRQWWWHQYYKCQNLTVTGLNRTPPWPAYVASSYRKLLLFLITIEKKIGSQIIDFFEFAKVSLIKVVVKNIKCFGSTDSLNKACQTAFLPCQFILAQTCSLRFRIAHTQVACMFTKIKGKMAHTQKVANRGKIIFYI
uniref:Uncharacterized protein n=1 Tax=Anguilla anguilla TaxID=7936 RepID=A0A0E9WRV5_ANGAN